MIMPNVEFQAYKSLWELPYSTKLCWFKTNKQWWVDYFAQKIR